MMFNDTEQPASQPGKGGYMEAQADMCSSPCITQLKPKKETKNHTHRTIIKKIKG